MGTIERVEEVPRSHKLMRLTVNFGDHSRKILAGIRKERENPQEIVGKQALFVVNLEPRKIAGEISEGMLFDLGYADGITPALAMPERPVPEWRARRLSFSGVSSLHRAKKIGEQAVRGSFQARDCAPPKISRTHPYRSESPNWCLPVRPWDRKAGAIPGATRQSTPSPAAPRGRPACSASPRRARSEFFLRTIRECRCAAPG